MRQYLDVLEEVLKGGVDRPNRTGVDSRALFGKQMRFNMADGFPVLTTKHIFFKSIKAELLWFIRGSDDVNVLNALGSKIWNANAEAPSWKPKARFPGDVGRIYGVQWRRWISPYTNQPIDQLANVISRIKNNPNDRRLIVTAWNPAELDMMSLPPCPMIFQFFPAAGKLSLLMFQRSCDMFLGVPFNISSYSLLLHMVAQVTGLEAHEFIHILGDAHIYHNHFDQVRLQLSREPLPLPQLWLNPEVKGIDDFTMDDIKLVNHQSHPAIPAPMAV
ncbi:MAG: thymidylate synthase [Parcubacteria group bacterium]|nr:thymidylate synthase [Parcubacteria group bacterium]